MKKQDKMRSNDVAHCPVCNANAVEPCQKPKVDECPRGTDRKKA